MRITICFGGSTFNPENLQSSVVKEMADVVRELRENEHEVLITTGGGNTSRSYIDVAKELGAPHKELDQIGIAATRLNARLLIAALKELAEPEPVKNFEKAIRTILRDKVPVMGGTQPGHTTDAVAAELANTSNSDLLVFFTDVDGVYTADPNEDENAEKIYSMTKSELSDLMSKMEFKPGMTAIIDPLAAEILQKTKIRTLVLGKEEIKRLPKIVEGAPHNGTEIKTGGQNTKRS